ncbi:MAG TPA: hypothetical protein VJ484_08205 [Lysobacter sp.]|nr:hypothetical protein [Lysobacter sp.]
MKLVNVLLMSFALSGLAFQAAASEREQLQLIAKEAGVSINDVRMVLGSRSQFPQYRTSFDRKEALVRAALMRIQARQNVPQDKIASSDK